VVPLGRTCEVRLRASQGQPDLDDAAGELPGRLEASFLEDTEHRAIVRKHLRDEALDADAGGMRSQTLAQACPYSPALKRVVHGKGDLGRLRVTQTDVTRDRHDALGSLR